MKDDILRALIWLLAGYGLGMTLVALLMPRRSTQPVMVLSDQRSDARGCLPLLAVGLIIFLLLVAVSLS